VIAFYKKGGPFVREKTRGGDLTMIGEIKGAPDERRSA